MLAAINMTDLYNSLTLMWQGMGGIFVVMVIIAVLTALFGLLGKKKK